MVDGVGLSAPAAGAARRTDERAVFHMLSSELDRVLVMPNKSLLYTVLVLLTPGLARAGDVEFNRDVRPIFAETCFHCHGPDSAARKADLRMDRREVAVKVGAIVPGKPEKSEMIARIFSKDPDELMPPPKSRKVLSAAQKDLLKRWVAEGAVYQPQWSLIAPKRPELPAVKQASWPRNPIDCFVLARLEQNGLQPAPEADASALARRVSLDLIGLPPTPEDVEAFVKDKDPGAYEKYVDRLLASPRWGEHRARYWLDAARYADTNGIHIDAYREIWSFRDWVIAAFNRNMPFDQFTIEQLAGDLLPSATLDQQIASGFNRCNITTSEGGAIDEEYKVLYARDRTETTSQVWLGLTAGCAVCHDHKFDPLTQREFYELSAYFNNTTQNAMDGNAKDAPPVIFVPRPEDRPRWDMIAAEIAAVRGQIEAHKQAARAKFDEWAKHAAIGPAEAQIPSESLRFLAPLDEGTGTTVRATVDGKPRTQTVKSGVAWDSGQVAAKSFKKVAGDAVEFADVGDFDKDQPFTCAAWVKLNYGGQLASVVARMDVDHDFRGWDMWLENGRLGTHIVNFWDKDGLKVLTNRSVAPGEWNHLLVSYDGSGKAEGVKLYINGELQQSTIMVNKLHSTIRTKVPLKIGQRSKGQALDNAQIQDLRIYGRTLPAQEVVQLAKASRAAWLAAKPAASRTKPESDELFAWWLGSADKSSSELAGKVSALEQEEAGMKSRGTIAHVMHDRGDKPEAFILYRGEYDKRRDRVTPGTPAMLPPMPADLPRDRLGLARWLMRPENPLTARVTVNRFWQQLFGTGLVRTAGDFGATGEEPSHPELLDWLAVEFRESGWDMKKIYKLMVMSATYRQANEATPEKLDKDLENRLLSRGPRFRMDAEEIRDYALAASGLLSAKIGGPSVKPYQPPQVWEVVAMRESNTHDYVQDHGESLYRRSLYTFWKRAAPPASLDIFNAPTREVCTIRRERTNTPLQALVTLNDTQYVEAARVLAERALKEGGSTAGSRLDFIARRLLSRSLRTEEVATVESSLKTLTAFYQAHADDANKLMAVGETKADPTLDSRTLAAWAMLTNELMNLDEVLNK
jgi:cytochrome c553